MKIKMLRSSPTGDGITPAGKTAEVTDKNGRFLIAIGAAVEVKAKGDKAEKEPAEAEKSPTNRKADVENARDANGK